MTKYPEGLLGQVANARAEYVAARKKATQLYKRWRQLRGKHPNAVVNGKCERVRTFVIENPGATSRQITEALNLPLASASILGPMVRRGQIRHEGARGSYRYFIGQAPQLKGKAIVLAKMRTAA